MKEEEGSAEPTRKSSAAPDIGATLEQWPASITCGGNPVLSKRTQAEIRDLELINQAVDDNLNAEVDDILQYQSTETSIDQRESSVHRDL